MSEFLHHLFLPRHTNNHRPRLLHHVSLLSIIVVLFFAAYFFPLISQSKPQILGIESNISAHELLVLTNLKRQDMGLTPLVMNEQLVQAANAKAQYMFLHNFWAHNAPDGTTPWHFVKSSGYEYTYAGENLARGFSTTGDVVNAWMDSPGHRENMLSPNYREIGFAVVPGTLLGDETILVVEMFGSRNQAPSDVSSVTNNTIPNPTPTAIALAPQQVLAQPTVTPTPTLTESTPTLFIQETPLPTQAVVSELEPHPTDYLYIASIQNNPLVDKEVFSKSVAIFLVGMFLFILAADVVIVERRQIVRSVGHNADHILYLATILFILLLLGGGAIL